MSNFDDLLTNSPEQSGKQLSKEEYSAKKQAEREAVFELSDNTALEVAGNGEMFKAYLDVQSNFDRYSAVNTLLIMAQQPEATRLGNFAYWKEKGGFVKSGETAISILEPHEYIKEDGSPGVGYNVKKVFDISQVDARRVKLTPDVKHDERQLLKALVSKAPVKITGVDELPDDLCTRTDPETGELFVRRGLEFPDTFRSIAQELCSAEASRDSLDPQFTAYCASYVLCKKYGVDTKDFEFDSVSYMLEGLDAQEVKHELSAIRNAAEGITERMGKQLEAANKAAKSQDAR